MGPSPHLRFLHSKQRLLDQNYKSLWLCLLILSSVLRSRITLSIGPRLHLWFCAFKTATLASEFTSLYGSQPSSVVLRIQNGDFSLTITSLYGSQPSFVVFACKTAPLAPELQVSIVPSPHLWFCVFTTATLCPELIVSKGPRHHLSFCACKSVQKY